MRKDFDAASESFCILKRHFAPLQHLRLLLLHRVLQVADPVGVAGMRRQIPAPHDAWIRERGQRWQLRMRARRWALGHGYARPQHRLLFLGVSLEGFEHADHGLRVDARLRAPVGGETSGQAAAATCSLPLQEDPCPQCLPPFPWCASAAAARAHVSTRSSCNRCTRNASGMLWHGNAPAAEQIPARRTDGGQDPARESGTRRHRSLPHGTLATRVGGDTPT